MWNLPGPGMEPVCPALAGRFLTPGSPWKPWILIFQSSEKFCRFFFYYYYFIDSLLFSFSLFAFFDHSIGLWDLNCPTRDWTLAFCSGNTILTTGPPGKSPLLLSSRNSEIICHRYLTPELLVPLPPHSQIAPGNSTGLLVPRGVSWCIAQVHRGNFSVGFWLLAVSAIERKYI